MGTLWLNTDVAGHANEWQPGGDFGTRCVPRQDELCKPGAARITMEAK